MVRSSDLQRSGLLGVLVLAFAGCTPLPRAGAPDRNFISEQEVRAAEVTNAYQLVERLRPLWLRSRGERSFRLSTEIVVYQDGVMLGDISVLEDIPIEIVRSLRMLDAPEAMRLPGLGSRHVERAIVVETRR